MINIGIIGVTGYAGVELLRLLHKHPYANIAHIFTDSYVDINISEVYPHLKKNIYLRGEKLHLENIIKNCELVFISLPHGHALEIAPKLLNAGVKIIDLGADFRIKDKEIYEKWYRNKAADSDILNLAVYGLPEMGNKKSIASASLIANPGCYPTATLLGAIPLFEKKIIDSNEIIIDAKSGVSGAGRKLSLQTHFCEMSENLFPYEVAGNHRHTPEIEQELSIALKASVMVQFTPHLVPLIRGMLVTSYFKMTEEIKLNKIHEIYCEFYKNEEFIRILNLNEVPKIKNVRGTNYCDIGIFKDERTKRLIIISSIDNLIKGAAGQAIQNMNLMYQFPESMGLLENLGIYP